MTGGPQKSDTASEQRPAGISFRDFFSAGCDSADRTHQAHQVHQVEVRGAARKSRTSAFRTGLRSKHIFSRVTAQLIFSRSHNARSSPKAAGS